MRQILFVDDEPNILNTYRNSMQKHQDAFDPKFASSGLAALDQLRETRFDAIVSDMDMPGMNGALLLGRVKEDYPDLVRIMLCNQSDTDAVLAALPVAHQVLPKPSDAETLCNSIERACRLRSLLTDSLRKRVGNIERLPSPSAVYLELMSVMSRPNVTTQKIARIVERDTAMAAKTLQLVNSACFGVSRRITALDQAISYLGMELIRNLALTVHIFAELERTALRSGFSFDAEQEHSILTARVAQRLISDKRLAQDAFTAGLLHDIGKLVLAVCIPDKFKLILHACTTSGRSQHEVEAETLGVTHAEVGAYLLGLWGLPYPIVEAVAYHHSPGAALERTFDIPTAVSIADGLVNEVLCNRPFDFKGHLESLNVIDQLPKWTAIAKAEVLLIAQPKSPVQVSS